MQKRIFPKIALLGGAIALGPLYYLWNDKVVPVNAANREETKKPTRYVIVGSGTSGYYAMKSIYEKDKNAQILMISEEDAPPYQRPPLSKELWFSGIGWKYKNWQGEEDSVFYQLPDEFQKIASTQDVGKTKVQFLVDSVQSIDLSDSQLYLKRGKVAFDKILIATGGKPVTPSQFKDIPGVMTFRGIKDYEKLSQLNDKTVAIVGGGFLGSELAVALAQKPLKVIQVFPEDGNMGKIFPKYLRKWTMSKLNQLGINVHPHAVIESVQQKDSQVEIRLKNEESIVADMVVVAAGLEPNTDIAKKSGLEIDEKKGGIIVNSELEARTNVFVAGDVCSYYDTVLGRRRVEHYDHAVNSGSVAGLNMTGSKIPYDYQSTFWSDLGPNISFEAVGIVDASLPTVGVWAKKHQSEEFDKGVVFYLTPEKKVTGILLWNIKNKMDLAKKILIDSKPQTDLNKLATLFNVHDE